MTNKKIIVKDESGSAGTYNIAVDGSDSETIDGAATKVITTNYVSITMYSNGSNWFVIGQSEKCYAIGNKTKVSKWPEPVLLA